MYMFCVGLDPLTSAQYNIVLTDLSYVEGLDPLTSTQYNSVGLYSPCYFFSLVRQIEFS